MRINQSEVKCAIDTCANQRAAGCGCVSHTGSTQSPAAAQALSEEERVPVSPPTQRQGGAAPRHEGSFMDKGFMLWHCLVPSDNLDYRCVLKGKVKSSPPPGSLQKCAFCHCNAAYNINRASRFSKSSFTAI